MVGGVGGGGATATSIFGGSTTFGNGGGIGAALGPGTGLGGSRRGACDLGASTSLRTSSSGRTTLLIFGAFWVGSNTLGKTMCTARWSSDVTIGDRGGGTTSGRLKKNPMMTMWTTMEARAIAARWRDDTGVRPGSSTSSGKDLAEMSTGDMGSTILRTLLLSKKLRRAPSGAAESPGNHACVFFNFS